MRAALLVASAAFFIAGCSADTEGLGPGRDASMDAGIPDPPDAGIDAGRDTGIEPECTQAADCRQIGLLPCEDITQCHCGCFAVCSESRCLGYCDDSPQCRPDAGVAPDGGGSCATHETCPDEPLSRYCQDQGGGTCAFSECVIDCAGPRNCDFDNNCLVCTSPNGDTRGCPACVSIGLTDATLEDSSCPLDFGDATLMFTVIEDCSFEIATGPASPIGKLIAMDNGSLVGELNQFATPCLVEFAPTGALRTIWSCPACTFTLFHH